MTTNFQAVAQLFGSTLQVIANVPGEIYPGYPGLVAAEGQLRQMTWGFPLTLTGKQGQKTQTQSSDECSRRQASYGVLEGQFHPAALPDPGHSMGRSRG
ncbi:hypothetical protein [Novosphingobium olei]|uniref:hypothetical protein n=1 Tax=Novosphingobium olei TaxID=2728851 RepID=UPI003B8A9325